MLPIRTETGAAFTVTDSTIEFNALKCSLKSFRKASFVSIQDIIEHIINLARETGALIYWS